MGGDRKRNEDGYMEDWAIPHLKEGTRTPIPDTDGSSVIERLPYRPPKGVAYPIGKYRHGLPYSI